MSDAQSPNPVISRLEGRECQFCYGGVLVRERFKDNRAVVCEECGVPHVQFW